MICALLPSLCVFLQHLQLFVIVNSYAKHLITIYRVWNLTASSSNIIHFLKKKCRYKSFCLGIIPQILLINSHLNKNYALPMCNQYQMQTFAYTYMQIMLLSVDTATHTSWLSNLELLSLRVDRQHISNIYDSPVDPVLINTDVFTWVMIIHIDCNMTRNICCCKNVLKWRNL